MKNVDHSMRILTGIAIILVVLGHLDCNVLSVFGLFPYYSYHVMIFLFVSGYFYKDTNEEHIFGYIKRKALHLLVPYYAWNIVYGVISTIQAGYGFTYANRISLYNFFIEPFLGGHQYGLNFAAWFVPALFVIELVNVIGRRILSLIHLKKEWLIFIISFILGIVTVILAQGGHVWGIYKTPGRILFMLPIYELGSFYRTYLEEKEKNLRNLIVIPVILAVQILLYLRSDGAMNFSAVWCTGFAGSPILPYLTTMTGTYLCLRISRILAKFRIGKVIETVGEHSFSIMMHHVTVFFVINLIAILVVRKDAEFSFDYSRFLEDINYVYLPWGLGIWKILYALCGIVIPQTIARGITKIKKYDLFVRK